jgi:hypothetical protein
MIFEQNIVIVDWTCLYVHNHVKVYLQVKPEKALVFRLFDDFV